MGAPLRREGGSFRDPASGVVLAGSRVLRYFDDDAAQTFSALAAGGVLEDLARRGAIIDWHAVGPDEAREVSAVAPRATLVLEHPRIPFVSYPYEWPLRCSRRRRC